MQAIPESEPLDREEALRLIVRYERGLSLPAGFSIHRQMVHDDPYGQIIVVRTPTGNHQVTQELLEDYKKTLPSLGQTGRPISVHRPKPRPNMLTYDDVMDVSHSMHHPNSMMQSQKEAAHQKLIQQMLMDSKPMVPPNFLK